jgi:hypothetical protein
VKSKYVDYQKLEFAIHSVSEQKTSTLVSKLSRIWHRFIESIITVNEFKIYSPRSKSGCPYWAIHDPISGRRVFFDSETEVRAWLDRRYYE